MAGRMITRRWLPDGRSELWASDCYHPPDYGNGNLHQCVYQCALWVLIDDPVAGTTTWRQPQSRSIHGARHQLSRCRTLDEVRAIVEPEEPHAPA